MKTIRQARLRLPGVRARLYEIDLVEQASQANARYLVNFRYGWEGGVLEEGTRTADAVTETEAVKVFESVIVARQNQGYQLLGAANPERKAPDLRVVKPDADPRETILVRRLRGFDALPDLKLAGLLRRFGELRLKSQSGSIVAVARSIINEGKRVASLRALPYALHRTDDGSGDAAAVLEKLSTIGDQATAETALVLRTIRDRAIAPTWSLYPLVLQSAVTLTSSEARCAAGVSYFQSAIAMQQSRRAAEAAEAEKALCMLYAHGAHEPMAREMVLAVLRAVPLQPPLFRAIRRILQVAEATDDADVFAILNARFDNERETVIAVAIDPANPRRGYHYTYAPKTRRYLRRRGWRTLRRLGEADDAAFAPMAAAVLLTLDDQTPKDTADVPVTLDLLPFADRYTAQKIMHGAGARTAASDQTLRWRYQGRRGTSASTREEPFQPLWGRHPQQLWRVLVGARAADPVAFAARALKENGAYLDVVSTADIAALLAGWQPYAGRLDLAIATAERRIMRDGLKVDLAAALMPEATRGGDLIKLVLASRPDALVGDPALFAALLSNCALANHTWFDPLALQAAAIATPAVRAFVLDRTLSGVSPAMWPNSETPRAVALAGVLAKGFADEIRRLDGSILHRLSKQPSEALQVLAARIASVRPDGASLIDVATLAQSPNAELRAAGIAMFAQRPMDALVADLDAVAAFLTATDAAPRAAARPIAQRLQKERPDAARALAEKLLPTLYRTEEVEGLREDVLGVLQSDLSASVVALGPETAWTLLRARSEPARRLGASVLDSFKATDFSVRQLARIGCNDQVLARQWAIAALNTRIADVRAEPEAGFALLDCSFDDAREAGYALYRSHLKPEDWSPTALVALADSTTEPAQRFGREMIGKVFEAKNADFLLSRLAEHPAVGFRLLVARLMRDYVQDDTQRLKKLVPAIETTLLQVRKGRAAKQQVLTFIEEQLGRQGNERLAILAPVLERTVATCAIDDRARLLALLTAIKHRNGELAPRVTILAREAR